MQTVTTKAFNQNPTAIKRAATHKPVKITERGKVSHVFAFNLQLRDLNWSSREYC